MKDDGAQKATIVGPSSDEPSRSIESVASGQPLLELAREAARVGGAHLLRRFSFDTDDASGAERARLLADEVNVETEQLIRDLIHDRRPDDGFVGEEGRERAGSTDLRWIVDALDGMTNFIAGTKRWCVSVAVSDPSGPVAGAIYDPSGSELFAALRGGDAERQRIVASSSLGSDSEPLILKGSWRADLLSAVVVVGLGGDDPERRRAQALEWTRVVPYVRDIRRAGSAALDLAWTAAGLSDAYFERGIEPWDYEAGLLMCERAGLRVQPLQARGDLPAGLLAAPVALFDQLLELLV